jgi:hypothetical protein
MKNTIKTTILASIYLVLVCSCNETKEKKVHIKQNKNDVFYDSLFAVFEKSKLKCDSLRMIFEKELIGTNGSSGYGPTAKKLESQIESYKAVNEKIRVQLNRVFLLTSKEFKAKYYSKVLSELDITLNENKTKLFKAKKYFENEVQGGGSGPEAMKLKQEMLYLEVLMKTLQIEKDSISNVFEKLK